MKFSITILIAFFSFAVTVCAQRKGSSVDIQHYVFEIEVNDTNDAIDGTATITFETLAPTNDITLDLISKTTGGKGMQITSATGNSKPLQYTHSGDSLRVRLAEPLNAGTKTSIQVKYKGIPEDGLIIDKNKYGNRTFFSDHWPNRARHWLPCVDHPSDKATIEFKIIAPLHFQVVSNGMMVEQTNVDDHRRLTHYREDRPVPMKVAAVGIADFAVRFEGEVNDIPVQSWVYPEDRQKGFYDYGLAVQVLPFFIENIGPYPFKKLANVQSKTIFGGMENAGAIFYYENSITGNRTAEKLIAHEIAHQWFGNMATEADWPHVWLSEGFATYLATLYMENAHGQDTAKRIRRIDRMKAIAFSKQRTTPIVDTTATNYIDLLNANSYQKAGWVLHMLRKELGDSTFWKCVRAYYHQYKGRNAVTDDFRRIVEEVSGKGQKQFFQQWMYAAGHPKLQMQWKFNRSSKSLEIKISQQQTTPFTFNLEMDIVTNDKVARQTVLCKEQVTTISIPVETAPVKIILDPDTNLFYESTGASVK